MALQVGRVVMSSASPYIYLKHTCTWNRHQNAKRICWQTGDGDIGSGAECRVKATDQTTSRFSAGIQKTKVERIAIGMRSVRNQHHTFVKGSTSHTHLSALRKLWAESTFGFDLAYLFRFSF